jgi:Fe-S cluster biogenesis protein NfuA
MVTRHEFNRRAGAIEELVHRLESAGDEAMRATARALVQALMDLHRIGLDRLMELTNAAGEPGAALIERFSEDDIVKQLLVLHGLHPVELEARVLRAIEKTRPLLASQGGQIDRVAVDETGAVTVTLRVEGQAKGCGSPASTLRAAVQDAIAETAPDAESVTVDVSESMPVVAAFVPIANVQRRGREESIGASAIKEGSVAHP